MKLVDLSLRRKVTVAMCAIAIVVFGLVAFTRLRVSLLPEISYPSITVETRLPGAAPAEIEQLLTRPTEERIGVVSGAERLTSASRPDQSQVTVEFGWGREMDLAAIDIREKLDRMRLPEGAEPPVLRRFDPAAEPILRLYLAGGDDPFSLRKAAEEIVERDLESTDGVAAIELAGGLEDEVEILVDEGKLAALGIALTEVGQKLKESNIDQAGGSLYEREARYLVRTHNRFVSLQDIRDTVLLDRETRRVRVGDVATVQRTHRARETVTRLAGAEAVELAIYKEGDANTVAVATTVDERLEAIRQRLPDGMELVVTADQSRFIRASVQEVLQSAALGGLFAILILLAFLKNLRSTLIIAAAIPISIVATFFLMHQTGTTLNVMSLGGLALGVGMLVDSAIVVLEAIHKRRERGATPQEAAKLGAGEVGRAVIAATLTTVAVFLPVVFLQGVAAQLFRDMAVTVCFSLVVSMAVALTLIPVLSVVGADAQRSDDSAPSRLTRVVAWPLGALLQSVVDIGRGLAWAAAPVSFAFDAVYRRVSAAYPGALRWSLRRPAAVLGVAGLAMVAALLSIPRLGLDLMPPLSQGEFAFAVELAPGAPVEVTDKMLQEAQAGLSNDTRVDRYSSVAGRGALGEAALGVDGQHVGLIQVRMAHGTGGDDELAVIDVLQRALDRTDVARARLVRPAVFSLRRPVEVEVYAQDLSALNEVGERVRSGIAALPGVTEARSSAALGHPEVHVRFDRERLAALGLDLATVAATVRGKLDGTVDTRLREGTRDVDMRVRTIAAGEATASAIGELIVGQYERRPIRLDTVATVARSEGPAEIRRVGHARVAVIAADVRGRDMGAVAADVQGLMKQLDLPEGVTLSVAGQQEEMFRSLRSLLLAVALAGFLVYIVMASQFESLLHPLVIFVTLPMGAVGVVAALLVTGSSVSVVSMIGVVMLAGIVVNNAIVLVDAINRRREAGESKVLAIVGAGRDRLRPILMTSATTILALLPLALAVGAGAELRRALAVVVVGGLTVATALTLLVIPVVYALIDRKRFEAR